MPIRVSVAEARSNFSKTGSMVAETGRNVTVFRNSKPWIAISPAVEPFQSEADETRYVHDVLDVLERGDRALEEGRFMDLDTFLAMNQGL